MSIHLGIFPPRNYSTCWWMWLLWWGFQARGTTHWNLGRNRRVHSNQYPCCKHFLSITAPMAFSPLFHPIGTLALSATAVSISTISFLDFLHPHPWLNKHMWCMWPVTMCQAAPIFLQSGPKQQTFTLTRFRMTWQATTGLQSSRHSTTLKSPTYKVNIC